MLQSLCKRATVN